MIVIYRQTKVGDTMDLSNIKENMPNDKRLNSLTNLFKVLGDNTRAKILYTLENDELCVSDICECVKMNTSAVSHQLRILRDACLVKARKEGKEVFYSLDDEHVSLIFKCALEHVDEN